MNEFLEWLDRRPRTYAETMEAWHSHCPRLLVWEDALADRLVAVNGRQVSLTAAGSAALAGRRDELPVLALVDGLPQ